MKNILGILLILGALGLGYLGVQKITNSKASIELLGLELSASDEDQKTTGYMYTGLAVVLFLGGVKLAKGK